MVFCGGWGSGQKEEMAEEELLFGWLMEELALLEEDECALWAPLWALLERRAREEGREATLGARVKERLGRRVVESPHVRVVHSDSGQPFAGDAWRAREGDVSVRCDLDLYWKYVGYPGERREGAFAADSPLHAIMRVVHESRRDCATVEYIYRNGNYAKGDVEELLRLLRPWVACVPAIYWEDDEQLGKRQDILLPTRYRLQHTLSLLRADERCFLFWDEVRVLGEILSEAPGQTLLAEDLKRAYLLQRQRIVHPFRPAGDMWNGLVDFAVREGYMEAVVAEYRVAREGDERAPGQKWGQAYILRVMPPTFEERLVVRPLAPRPTPPPEGGYLAVLLKEVTAVEPQILSGDWHRRLGLSREQLNVLRVHLQMREDEAREEEQLCGSIVEFGGSLLYCGPAFQAEQSVSARLLQLLRHRGKPARLADLQAFFSGSRRQLDTLLNRASNRRKRDGELSFRVIEDGGPGREIVASSDMADEVIEGYLAELRRARWVELPPVAEMCVRDSAALRLKGDELFSRKHAGYLSALGARLEFLHTALLSLNLAQGWNAEDVLDELSPSQFGRLFIVGPLALFPWKSDEEDLHTPLRNVDPSMRSALLGSKSRQRAARVSQLGALLSHLEHLGLVTARRDEFTVCEMATVDNEAFAMDDEEVRRAFWAKVAQQKREDKAWSAPADLPADTAERLERWAFSRGLQDLPAMAKDARVTLEQLHAWLGEFAVVPAEEDDDVDGQKQRAHKQGGIDKTQKRRRTVVHLEESSDLLSDSSSSSSDIQLSSSEDEEILSEDDGDNEKIAKSPVSARKAKGKKEGASKKDRKDKKPKKSGSGKRERGAKSSKAKKGKEEEEEEEASGAIWFLCVRPFYFLLTSPPHLR